MSKNKTTQIQNKSSRRKWVITAVIVLSAIAGYVYMAATWSPADSESQKASENTIRKLAARLSQKAPEDLNDNDFANITYLIIGESTRSSRSFVTELSDIKLLEKFTNLEVLSLGRIVYPKKDVPKWMTVLQKTGMLDIDKRFALDLTPLEKLQHLKSLTIRDTAVKDLKPLANISSLQQLNLPNTNLENIKPLKNSVNLQRLVIDDTEVSDLKPIEDLKNLEYLSISRTKVKNLEPLKKLTNLQVLYAYQTQVSSLEPLRELKNLRNLYLGIPEISNLESIKNLTQLEILDISNTLVSDLEPLKGLTKLRQLDLQYCKNITDEQVADLQKALPNLEIKR